MRFNEWRSLWRIDHDIQVPHLSIVVMTPYLFVRLMWYTTSKEFKAWPCTWDTGVVVGWRWPFRKQFKEKAWIRRQEMPLAIYGAMDEIYVARAVRELGWDTEDAVASTARMFDARFIGATIRELNRLEPIHAHNCWIANCPDCARRALNLAVHLQAQLKPKSVPDPHESPLAAFQRREEEAKKRLGVGQ